MSTCACVCVCLLFFCCNAYVFHIYLLEAKYLMNYEAKFSIHFTFQFSELFGKKCSMILSLCFRYMDGLLSSVTIQVRTLITQL